MSNHSDRPDPEMQEHLRKQLMRQFIKEEFLKDALGATGMHPEGKLTKHDKGEVVFAVGQKDGKVVIEFDKPMHWLGMTPAQAIELAGLLISRARQMSTLRKEKVNE